MKLSKCVSMILAGASLLPSSAPSEVCEKGEKEPASTASLFGDVGWLIVLAGLVCFLHMVKDLGLELVKRVFSGRGNVEVKLLDEKAKTSTGLAMEIFKASMVA